MQKTPKGLRLQIGIFGKRNAGKSSLLNALTGQEVSIVSSTPGTTADPVEITFSGPEKSAFAANPGGEPNSYGLTAYNASPIPLTVTASCNGYTVTAQIALVT